MRPSLFAALIAFALFVAALGLASAGETEKTPKLTGLYVEFCSCERFCETALSDGGRRASCDFVSGLRIEAGQRGDVSLGGLYAAIVAPSQATIDARSASGPVLYMDPAATPLQSAALREFLAEQFASRAGGTLGPPRVAPIHVNRTSETLTVSIEGVADLRARPIVGVYRRSVQLENATGTFLPFPAIGRGIGGQVADSNSGVRFDAAGKSVFHGKFDFGAKKGHK